MQIPFCIPFKLESTLAVLCNPAHASLPRWQRRMEPFLMPHRQTRLAYEPRLKVFYQSTQVRTRSCMRMEFLYSRKDLMDSRMDYVVR